MPIESLLSERIVEKMTRQIGLALAASGATALLINGFPYLWRSRPRLTSIRIQQIL